MPSRPRKASRASSRRPRQATAAEIIAFIERYCRTPEGPSIGKPIRLAPYQLRFIRAVYGARKGPIRLAILSTGKKNGKTTLIACLLLAHLCGPCARDRPNSQIYSAAQSLPQAALVFNAVVKMIRLHPDLSAAVRIQESRKSLVCPELGITYRALSADAATSAGVAPQVAIFDELGQCRGPTSALFEHLERGGAALLDPLTIVISTQAPTDEDLLSILIDDGLAGHDPATIVHLYAADAAMSDLYGEKALRKANPAYDHFQNKGELLKAAAKARRLPSFAAGYKNLNLNMRVESGSPFLARDVWAACAAPPRDPHGFEVYGGLDLSSVNDLTAFVMAGRDPIEGSWSVECRFWLPSEGLLEREERDRLPYRQWIDAGCLELTPGPTVGFDHVAAELVDLIAEYRIRRINYDRWRIADLKPALARAGMSEQAIDNVLSEFGQGFKSMSPAISSFEALTLERKIRHGGHPVLSMCVSNAVVVSDDAGNRKLSRKRSRRKIDGLVSLVMALAAASAKSTTIDVSTLIA
jgi:phage terminase large subunit-like protein